MVVSLVVARKPGSFKRRKVANNPLACHARGEQEALQVSIRILPHKCYTNHPTIRTDSQNSHNASVFSVFICGNAQVFGTIGSQEPAKTDMIGFAGGHDAAERRKAGGQNRPTKRSARDAGNRSAKQPDDATGAKTGVWWQV